MKVLDCTEFKKWLSQYRDYLFVGGSQPSNPLPEFFRLEVYQNASIVNSPSNFVSTIHESGFPSMGSFILKCAWDFEYVSKFDFHQEKNISYFSREIDYLEIRDNVAFYNVNLNMEHHVGKIVYQMENIVEDNNLLHCKVFLPELDLKYVDKEDMFSIMYSQNQHGIGFQNSNPNITREGNDGFYFNKPFFIHIYIDLKKVLSLYVDKSRED